MSDDLVQLAGRVQRIERRLKLGAGVLAAVLVAVATVAAVLPEQVPEVIEARAFRVLDENGTLRAGLGAPGLAFYSEDGTIQTAHAPDGLRFYTDEQSYSRLAAGGLVFVDVDELGAVIASMPEQVPEVTWKRIVAREFLVLDELGERRAYLGPGGLEFFDEQGTRRIALYSDGRRAGQLAFLDEEGAVIEILPR